MILKFLKPFSFLPAILLMYMIFTFSAQEGDTSAALSYKVSCKIVEIGGEVLGADLQPWEIDQLANRFHTPVRKLAHMTEYFLLAISVAFPLYVYGLRGIWLLLAAGVICVAFACSDEYHQSYVAGRGPSKKDVLIDSVGVFFGIIVVRIIGWTGRNTIFRPFARKKNKKEKTPDPYMGGPGSYIPPQPPQMQAPQGGPGYPGYYRQPYRADNRQPQGAYFENDPRGPYPPYESYPPQEPYPPHESYSPQEPYPPYESYSPQEPYPSYMLDDYDYYDDESTATSDRLSEDMSFRKLVSDLREQKQTRRGTRRADSAKDGSAMNSSRKNNSAKNGSDTD